MKGAGIGWLGIVRLGLVQVGLGSIVVLTTSTLNRVMVVELMLPAMLPGLLVGIHYTVQLLRPQLGHGSDVGGRRTPWIIGGMAILALGGTLAAVAVALMGTAVSLGVGLAVLAFLLIGAGVGAAGTALLVLLALSVRPEQRAPAATTCWLMMIAGFAITAGIAGHFLDPYSPERLVSVMAVTAGLAFALSVLAVRGIEARGLHNEDPRPRSRARFGEALREVWAEAPARRFTLFIFVSMLAFSAQDLILEPYAGAVFGYTPGESTQLAGLQHAGVLLGMILVALLARSSVRGRSAFLTGWIVAGCVGAALVLAALALGGFVGPGWPLDLNVFLLGLTVGAFSVAAISSMMGMVESGHQRREGLRMGLWGAAQGIAFGFGAFLGTAAIDWTRHVMDSPVLAYSTVFLAEAVLFLVSAAMALWVDRTRRAAASAAPTVAAPLAPGRVALNP